MGYAKEEEGTAKWAPCFVFAGLSGNLRVAGWSVSGGMQLREEEGGAGVGTVVVVRKSSSGVRGGRGGKMISRKSRGAWMMMMGPPLQGE